MKRLLSILCSLLVAVAVMSQEEHLRLKYDFEDVTGTNVKDAVSGVAAYTINKAKVEELGPYHVLNLGKSNGYLRMHINSGKIVKDLDDFTVSACYRVAWNAAISGSGNFLWTFSTSENCTETNGSYFTCRLNAQRVSSSMSGYGREKGVEVGAEAVKGRWVHFLYRQSGGKGEVFIDGRRVLQASNMPSLKQVFQTAIPTCCWIGRAPFTGDSYLKNTLVADFRIYDVAVSNEKVKQLSTMAEKLETEYRYSIKGDATSYHAVLESCKQFLSAPTDEYAPIAVAELQDMVETAEKELDASRASQAILDQYAGMLNSSLQKAEKTKGYQNKPLVDYKTGRQGFVHPGALVSQVDIDRIKEKIKKPGRVKTSWENLCNNQWSWPQTQTWPTSEIKRGADKDNYMNAARGAHSAFQKALHWKISGDKAHADAAVNTLMSWCRITREIVGDTNASLAAGLYGYEFANAAELMRDYEGWSPEEFEEFKQWMIKVFYNRSIDFLRRRHDTWANWRYPAIGERPGHYWSNWGLCNALCVISIGILCDDVHMYNQGMSFYKYDHQGTFIEDRSKLEKILNDGCNEFIGNLVPVIHKDERGPLGYLGQMQESGRDQGHSVMALGLALDICQVGFNQGDDLFAYMDDRILAGTEYVAAMNFANVENSQLPWTPYEYAGCAAAYGSAWLQPWANPSGVGERRPMWDRARGYYEGLRGIKLNFTDIASDNIGPDGGGGNYNLNSGGYDLLGFSTLTQWRPLIEASEAITPLSGDIIYKGETLKNQTNLGGLKYRHELTPSHAIPADGAEITLVPQLPEGTEDTGKWLWDTGETTREIKVKADRSSLYRVTYTNAAGKESRQVFAVAVAGDSPADDMHKEITVNGVVEEVTEKTVLRGTSVTLFASATTGWSDDYIWNNGAKGNTLTIPSVTEDRTYICQFTSMSGAVSEAKFNISVIPALPFISVDSMLNNIDKVDVLKGSDVILGFDVVQGVNAEDIVWQDGSHGTEFVIENIQDSGVYTATLEGREYTFTVNMKEIDNTYSTDILTKDNGYTRVLGVEQLNELLDNCYFVICAEEADLMLHLANGKRNGNKALCYTAPVSPETNFSTLFTVEPFDGGYCFRNIDYDCLLLQTEADAPHKFHTNDQPEVCSWTRFLLANDGSAWTIENGSYPTNYLGLWTYANGYADGEELACNKQGEEFGHYQIYAIEKRLLFEKLAKDASDDTPKDMTVFIDNPNFNGNSWTFWDVTGTFGNQRFNGAVETWHSTNFSMQQTLSNLPAGFYTVTCQMVNGEGQNTGYLFATAGKTTVRDVVKQSCAGSNFDAERNKLNNLKKHGLLSVDIYVPVGCDLTFGLKEPANGTTWLVFDNFHLYYKGDGNVGISKPQIVGENGATVIYDLQGRRIDGRHVKKGIYIVNGRKMIVQ